MIDFLQGKIQKPKPAKIWALRTDLQWVCDVQIMLAARREDMKHEEDRMNEDVTGGTWRGYRGWAGDSAVWVNLLTGYLFSKSLSKSTQPFFWHNVFNRTH